MQKRLFRRGHVHDLFEISLFQSVFFLKGVEREVEVPGALTSPKKWYGASLAHERFYLAQDARFDKEKY